MSEALKSNTTLNALKYRGEDKKERRHTKNHQQITLFLVLLTGNDIRERGAKLLGVSLKSNTTLTQLNLGR